MRKIRLSLVPLVLLLCTAFACPPGSTPSQRQQVAQAAHDASVIMRNFHDGEIVTYNMGRNCVAVATTPEAVKACAAITPEEHAFIQNSLITVGVMGKTLDGCIASTTDNPGIVRCVETAITAVDKEANAGRLHLTSDRARTGYLLAMIGLRTSLEVIRTILTPVPAPSKPAPTGGTQ